MMSRSRTWVKYNTGTLCFLLLLCAGCSTGPKRAADVEPEKARDALRTALESWKKGDKPETLQQRSPAITVQDMDWESGLRLLSYELKDEGSAYDANLYCEVRLTLRTPQGAEAKKEVTYIVGTSPVLTVFRKLF
jgi:hypothetical protein